MNINIKTIVYAVAMIGLFVACGKSDMLPEEKPLDYPKKYTLTGLDFQPTAYFEYQSDGFEQVYPAAIQSIPTDTIDAIVFTEYYEPIANSQALKEIELLSDTLARMLIQSEFQDTPLDTTLCYEIQEERIRLFLCDAPEEVVELNWLAEADQISNCIQFYAYSYFDSAANERTIGPGDGDICFAGDTFAILDSIVLREQDLGYLQVGDTIILNVSPVIFDAEE